MKLKATDVFVPGAYPQYTYVQRADQALEQALRDAIDTPGQLVSLAGPSKSGKTVLVEKVVGKDHLISISGVGIRHPEDLWSKVLNWMDVEDSVSETTSSAQAIEASGKAGGKAGVLGLASGSIEAGGRATSERGTSRTVARSRAGLVQVQREISDSDYVVFVDDFHYMPRDVQAEAAKALKEAVRLGIRICTASVLHRGDDVVRANPELRGRIRSVDLQYWSIDDLVSIGATGFHQLRSETKRSDLEVLAREAAGSPQLMQQICLQACFVCGIREASETRQELNFSGDEFKAIFEQTSSTTDFRTLVDVLDAGPRTRGTERKIYAFIDQTSGDVYRCVLKAIAADPPALSFPYDELLRRTTLVCSSESPVGSSVIGTCSHMAKLAEDKFPSERVIDWDEQKQVLDMPDPYLAFFLRWSGRLMEADAV